MPVRGESWTICYDLETLDVLFCTSYIYRARLLLLAVVHTSSRMFRMYPTRDTSTRSLRMPFRTLTRPEEQAGIYHIIHILETSS